MRNGDVARQIGSDLSTVAGRTLWIMVRHALAGAVGVLTIAACSGGTTASTTSAEQAEAKRAETETERAVESGTASRLVRLAPGKLSHCRRSVRLREICPTLVPQVGAPYLTYLSDAGPDALFNMERGLPGNPPPGGAHITIGAGDVEMADPFEHPLGTDEPADLDDGVLDEERTEAVSFGRVKWGARESVLFLAPPFVHGGQLGNHLVFEWNEGDDGFVYSLHAWKPLADTAATLREMAEAVS